MSKEYELLLDEEHHPILIEEECKNLRPIVEEFVKSYSADPEAPVEKWLVPKMREHLPKRSKKEIEEMVDDIITTIKVHEEKKASLQKAIETGRSKESWFASDITATVNENIKIENKKDSKVVSDVKVASSAVANVQAAKYLTSLDTALQTANESLYSTITTQAGAISQNPCLDGYIAEQYHVQTFNMNAEATGSPYRARVKGPGSKGYTKNSVDIEIIDTRIKGTKSNVVRRYQSKYCKDAKATEKAFEKGDYRGQRKLVPEEQGSEISKKSSTVIEAPDGTKSNPLSKRKAEQMRDEAQSGKWNDLNWNEYKTKDLALGIGKQAGYAAIQGAAISVGFDVAGKLFSGEPVEADEVVEKAVVSGADFGVKAATAGAIKVGVEKGTISVIAKGTPMSTITTIAHTAIENVKVLGQMATGELTMKEGLDKMGQTTCSTVAGMATLAKGTGIGAAIGTVFGPIGTAVGGFVGGTIGYMAGSKVGETIAKCAGKIRDGAVKVVKTIAKGVKSVVGGVARGIGRLVSGIFSFFG